MTVTKDVPKTIQERTYYLRVRTTDKNINEIVNFIEKKTVNWNFYDQDKRSYPSDR